MRTGDKYPLAVVVGYGPDHRTVTKLVASIFKNPGQREPVDIEKWFAHEGEGDIRKDPALMGAMVEFIKRHHVTDNVVYNWVWGCPHEEGIDYPEGGVCPHCPFWANLDRHTLEPKSPDLPLTPKQILAGLSIDRDIQPLKVFAAAERNRDQMVEPFLQAAEYELNDPARASMEDSPLLSYALAFLAKWREPRVFPLVLRWLALPGEQAFDLGGDTVTEWGSRLLATVCGGDLAPIKQLILNRDANEFCRAQAIDALAIFAACNEPAREEMVDYLSWLARDGLEREPGVFWDCLLGAAIDLEAFPVFDHLRQAVGNDYLDPRLLQDGLNELKVSPRGQMIADFRESHPPFNDVVRETGWWACFSKDGKDLVPDGAAFNAGSKPPPYGEPEPYVAPTPYIAPPKIGRNDRCPCGSGKKYKKCCGG